MVIEQHLLEILQRKCYTIKNGVLHYTLGHYTFPVIKNFSLNLFNNREGIGCNVARHF